MDEAEKMILEALTSDINTLNKNTLYLCRHVTSTESRLESIEKAMKINDSNTTEYGNKINKIEGKLLGASTFIAIIVSLVMGVCI